MALLAAPTVDQLAEFAGRTVEQLGDYAPTALAKSALLFQVSSGLNGYPGSDPDLSLMTNAILEMADLDTLANLYREKAATPFASETAADYSYTKYSKASANARVGKATGLTWWDLAIAHLASPASPALTSNSTSVFERDARYVRTDTGQETILGPAVSPLIPLPAEQVYLYGNGNGL